MTMAHPAADRIVLQAASRALGKIEIIGGVGALTRAEVEAMALALLIFGLRPVQPGHPFPNPILRKVS